MMLRGLILGMVVCHIVSAQQPVHAEVDDLHDLQFESSTPEDPEPVNLKERLRTPEPPLRPSPRVRSAASPQLDRQHPQDPPAAQAFATAAADGEDDASGSAIFGHPVSVNMASLGHLAGECAVGLSIGAAAAWTLRRLQGMVMLLGTLSTVGTIAALHLKWISPEQVCRVLTLLAALPSMATPAVPAAPTPPLLGWPRSAMFVRVHARVRADSHRGLGNCADGASQSAAAGAGGGR